MNIHPVVASVVGQINHEHWGQVLQTPHAYGVIEVYAPDGIARQKGVEILTKLTNRLSDPPVSLSGLEEIAEEMVIDDVISLILFVPVGNVLYLVSRGVGQVYLARGSKLAVLIQKPGSLSGEVQKGDTVIAASAGFVDVLTQEEILGVFDHNSPQEVAEKLTIMLHERQGGYGGAAFIFHAQAIEETDQSFISPVVEKEPRPQGFIGKIKALGRKFFPVARRFTSARQRMQMRKLWHIMKLRVQQMSPKRVVTTLVISLFVLSILFGITHRGATATSSKTQDILAAAQHAFDEGVALSDLNPVKSRERFVEAKELLAPVVAKKSRSAEAKKAKTLYDLVNENLIRAMRIVQAKPEVFFDASLLKGGAKISEMSLFESSMGLLDTAGKTLFTVDIATKRGAIVAGGESFTGASHIAAYSDKLYVWSPTGITAVRLSDQKTTPNQIPPSDEWGNIVSIVGFGGNIYLLDTNKSKIWKYVATEKGFTELREYLNADFFPDLTQKANMVIDGSVWLGSIDGTLTRFTSGKESTFVPAGLDTKFGNALVVYTSDEAKQVYVLDRANHRVVAMDKDGVYMGQYQWGADFDPTALAVSEKEKKILLLSGGIIYWIPLE